MAERAIPTGISPIVAPFLMLLLALAVAVYAVCWTLEGVAPSV